MEITHYLQYQFLSSNNPLLSKSLSSKNFTLSILEYLDPYDRSIDNWIESTKFFLYFVLKSLTQLNFIQTTSTGVVNLTKKLHSRLYSRLHLDNAKLK